MFTVSKSPSNISVEYLTFTEVTKWLSVYILSADFEIDMIKIAKRKVRKTKIKQLLFDNLTIHFIKESFDIFNHWYTLKSSPSLQTH